MQAYVLVKASAKQIEAVLEAMRSIDGIVEASTVYGETDVICRVEVPDQAQLDRLVMRDLHAIRPSSRRARSSSCTTCTGGARADRPRRSSR